jgi:predicted short-subunit dehydrogenase-like oxidoreductase (DUF2520 family)
MNVSVVGAGRVGTAMAVLLGRAGHRIVAVSGRGATRDRASRFLSDVPFLDPIDAARAGELVLIGVPDDEIPAIVGQIAGGGGFRPGQWVAHLSGASGLDVLSPGRAAGARPLALHPLQTFPDVAGALERLPGCVMAVTAEDAEGYMVGERIADDLMTRSFRLDDAMRPLYHAAAVFASNYLVVASGIAEDLFRLAGVPDPLSAMLPLQRASLDNVERLGPGEALTGPAVRGDASTIERNLVALRASRPNVVAAYVELCRAALALASVAGRLPEARLAAVEEVLARWS